MALFIPRRGLVALLGINPELVEGLFIFDPDQRWFYPSFSWVKLPPGQNNSASPKVYMFGFAGIYSYEVEHVSISRSRISGENDGTKN